MLTFILIIAAFGLVMTALTYAELRQPVGGERKWPDLPIALRAFMWVALTSIVVLLLIGIAT